MQSINYSNYQRPSDYLKFKAGETRIRIISPGVMGLFHSVPTPKFTPLGFCTEDSFCKHCAKGNLPKEIWRWVAVNLETNTVQLLTAGPKLGNKICEMGEDPQNYDILVTAVGERLKRQYSVERIEGKAVTMQQMSAWKFRRDYLLRKYFTR